MARTYYRLVITVLCALAAYITPVPALRYPYNLGYFVGGLAAALLAWAFLAAVIALEPGVRPHLQLVLGAGAGVFSWGHATLVATFDILPLFLQRGGLNDTFDPIWILGGYSPLIVPVVGLWMAGTAAKPYWQGLASALYRFSVPLALLQLPPALLGLPRQYRWIFLFAGVMFLVLDGLGIGRNWPLVGGREKR